MQAPGSTTYLTPAEVAEDLRVSAMTVTRWCHDGTVKAIRVGRLWRIDRAAYEAFKLEAAQR